MSKELKSEKLDFWIKNNYNVLLVGKHGVGKTAIIKDAFERAGLRWKYFSASTLDPWVDLVGVPKEVQSENGNYLDLVRPKEFQYDEVDALFFDEFNRSHKKVRNAVMELLQFKSINGKKFNNLKIVWAAVNPSNEEGEYDVEKIDPAQEDRFHIKIDVPYKPIESYFANIYGKNAARAAISWWDELPDQQKDKVSPRRLDYAIDVYVKGGDLRDVLPESTNIAKLISSLKFGPISDKLALMMKNNSKDEASVFLTTENHYNSSVDWILKNKDRRSFFLPLLEKEKISSLLQKETVFNTVIDEAKQNPKILDVLSNVINANQNKTLVKKIYQKTRYDPILGQLFGGGDPTIQVQNVQIGSKPIFLNINQSAKDEDLNTYLSMLPVHVNTYHRKKQLDALAYKIPKELSSKTATQLMTYIIGIARATQTATLVKWKLQFMGILNHLISETCRQEKINWNDFMNKYLSKGLGYRLMSKIRASSALLEALHCPK